MKIGAIIQARYGSTRLPGKVLLPLGGRSVLYHDIERVKQAERIEKIIIATSTHKQDDKIVKEAKSLGATYFRGSEQDVLARYYHAAKENKLDTIVRITSDCPLIDPFVVEQGISLFLEHETTIVTNATTDVSKRTFPRGLDVEVFSFDTLEWAFQKAVKAYQREHVTPFIYESVKQVTHLFNDVDYSNYRWTLDTREDYELITQIYDHLYKGYHNFYLSDIINLMEKYPELKLVNAHVEQKRICTNCG